MREERDKKVMTFCSAAVVQVLLRALYLSAHPVGRTQKKKRNLEEHAKPNPISLLRCSPFVQGPPPAQRRDDHAPHHCCLPENGKAALSKVRLPLVFPLRFLRCFRTARGGALSWAIPAPRPARAMPAGPMLFGAKFRATFGHSYALEVASYFWARLCGVVDAVVKLA